MFYAPPPPLGAPRGMHYVHATGLVPIGGMHYVPNQPEPDNEG